MDREAYPILFTELARRKALFTHCFSPITTIKLYFGIPENKGVNTGEKLVYQLRF